VNKAIVYVAEYVFDVFDLFSETRIYTGSVEDASPFILPSDVIDNYKHGNHFAHVFFKI